MLAVVCRVIGLKQNVVAVAAAKKHIILLTDQRAIYSCLLSAQHTVSSFLALTAG